MIERREPVYFGCDRGAGHFAFEAGASPKTTYTRESEWIAAFDGRLTPRSSDKQGAGALHYLHGYYVLAFHDYTVDKRPASNSAFWIPKETLALEYIGGLCVGNAWKKTLEKSRELWPWVFARPLNIFEA